MIGQKNQKVEELIKHTFLIFLFLSLVFFVEGITTGPFQKVIIAPIGEEPLKFVIAFCLFYEVITIGTRLGKQREIDYMRVFRNTFVYFSMASGFLFGVSEYLGGSSLQNIFSHFSFSTIGAILIVFWFDKIKYPYKKLGFLLVGVSMLLHSISNQYANITCVTNRNEYLVVIAKFLREYTPLVKQWDYTRVIYYIALSLFLIYFWLYTFPELKRMIK